MSAYIVIIFLYALMLLIIHNVSNYKSIRSHTWIGPGSWLRWYNVPRRVERWYLGFPWPDGIPEHSMHADTGEYHEWIYSQVRSIHDLFHSGHYVDFQGFLYFLKNSYQTYVKIIFFSFIFKFWGLSENQPWTEVLSMPQDPSSAVC